MGALCPSKPNCYIGFPQLPHKLMVRCCRQRYSKQTFNLMRKPSDCCLLCKVNPAVKTKSHIYPKFISTNFLGPKGMPRKGFILNNTSQLGKTPQVVQDSPKEDYILCEICEAYFSVIEGIASDIFINWQTKVLSGDYLQTQIANDLSIIDCATADSRTLHLFVYSIFWRASISSLTHFNNIRIESDFEEELRNLLMTYRHDNRTNYLNTLSAAPNFKVFPYTIFTAKSFKDETSNLLLAPPAKNPYSLVIDRFAAMLFRSEADIKEQLFRDSSNKHIDDCRIMLFSEQLWKNAIIDQAFNLLKKGSK